MIETNANLDILPFAYGRPVRVLQFTGDPDNVLIFRRLFFNAIVGHDEEGVFIDLHSLVPIRPGEPRGQSLRLRHLEWLVNIDGPSLVVWPDYRFRLDFDLLELSPRLERTNNKS